MRLLTRKANGTIAITNSFDNRGDIPPYAILSHVWSADSRQEVTFQEVMAGSNKSKAGWGKIHFCADRAAGDGLQYFWIDTCCIDKANSVELQMTINSMFRWYQMAERCYVYLPDVTACGDSLHSYNSPTWHTQFKASRWFTRGWTLQELIAPKVVEFFDPSGKKLGDKTSLRAAIEAITGISAGAFCGDALSDFSISDRLSWAKQRQTSISEDKAYSIMGIFDVSMPVIYGEGWANAHRRLEDEIHRGSKDLNYGGFNVGLDLSSMPRRAPFIAREEELREIHEILHGHNSRSVAILHGLSGMGKTQLAIEYTRRHMREYSAIFWLSANNAESLSLSFQGIARQVLKEHPSTVELAKVDLSGDLVQAARAVIAWLESPGNTRWILIYDNVEDPKSSASWDVPIFRFLPESDHGSIIITTRSANLEIHGRLVHVSRLSRVKDGVEILLRASGRTFTKKDRTEANAIELVKELDGVPLALSMAGAYLGATSTSYREFLRLYRGSRTTLEKDYRSLKPCLNYPLYTTWQISHSQIQQQNPFSANMLKLWAYLDPHDLWFDLLCHGGSTDHLWIQELTRDELECEAAFRVLHVFNLIEPSSLYDQHGLSGYSMHHCVHDWTTSVLNREWDESLARLALTCVALEVPSTDEEQWWIKQRRLLQHARRLERFIVAGSLKTSQMEWALCRLGGLFAEQNMLAEAEAMYRQALQGYEMLGEKQTSAISAMSSLGSIYAEQGKLDEAEMMYLQALQGREETLGADHTLTLDTINDLGNAYADQGKLEMAEQMYLRALTGKEKVLGPDHTSTLDVANNLAVLYAGQGKLEEAERMYLRALSRYEKALGRDHTSTLSTINNLGNLYYDQGRLDMAEQMYLRALTGKEKVLGPDHTSTLDAVNNLGSLYSNQGKLDEAEQMLVRVLAGKEKALGGDHPSTLITVNNLGSLYSDQGKLDEAEQMLVRALAGKEKALGRDHPSTQRTSYNLNALYHSQGYADRLARSSDTTAMAGEIEPIISSVTPKMVHSVHTSNSVTMVGKRTE